MKKTNKDCEHCPKRGRCCKNFQLKIWDRNGKRTPAFTSKDSRKNVLARIKNNNWPFVPRRKNKYVWKFRCPKIGKDGKCTIYKHRPQLCRDFKVGSDVLCYYYKENVR